MCFWGLWRKAAWFPGLTLGNRGQPREDPCGQEHASLSRFISKLGEHSLPLIQVALKVWALLLDRGGANHIHAVKVLPHFTLDAGGTGPQ
jgi:hypothetical protein